MFTLPRTLIDFVAAENMKLLEINAYCAMSELASVGRLVCIGSMEICDYRQQISYVSILTA